MLCSAPTRSPCGAGPPGRRRRRPGLDSRGEYHLHLAFCSLEQPWSGLPGRRAGSSCWHPGPAHGAESTALPELGLRSRPRCWKAGSDVSSLQTQHQDTSQRSPAPEPAGSAGADGAGFPPLAAETHFVSSWLFSWRLNEIRMGLSKRGKQTEQIEMEGEGE